MPVGAPKKRKREELSRKILITTYMKKSESGKFVNGGSWMRHWCIGATKITRSPIGGGKKKKALGRDLLGHPSEFGAERASAPPDSFPQALPLR